MLSLFAIALFFPSVYCLEYDTYEGHSLSISSQDLLQNIRPLSFQLCIKECELQKSCVSINYNANYLTCSLLRKSHLDSGFTMMTVERNAYVYLKQKNQPCNNCTTYQRCVPLSSGGGACSETNDCKNPPTILYAYYTELSDPPTATYNCIPGYTAVGTTTFSTCYSGELWSPIDLQCEPPVHGGWSGWTHYGDCSVTYGRGVRVRSRACDNPEPQYNGMDCIGANTSTLICRTCANPGYMIAEALNVGWSSVLSDTDGSQLNLYWLNSVKSWTPSQNSNTEYIQATFPEKRYIMGIGIKGRHDEEEYVKTFRIYTVDYEGGTLRTSGSWTSTGNTDQNTLVQPRFEPYLYTAGIRIYPMTWQNKPSLRFDVYGCIAAPEN